MHMCGIEKKLILKFIPNQICSAEELRWIILGAPRALYLYPSYEVEHSCFAMVVLM
jgi:hypothetical protein